MLAEIFLLRLQTMLRASGSEQMSAITNMPRFVPIVKHAAPSSGKRRAA